jgi:hypothetical protein
LGLLRLAALLVGVAALIVWIATLSLLPEGRFGDSAELAFLASLLTTLSFAGFAYAGDIGRSGRRRWPALLATAAFLVSGLSGSLIVLAVMAPAFVLYLALAARGLR